MSGGSIWASLECQCQWTMLFLNRWRVSSHILRYDTNPPAIQNLHSITHWVWAFRIRAVVLLIVWHVVLYKTRRLSEACVTFKKNSLKEIDPRIHLSEVMLICPKLYLSTRVIEGVVIYVFSQRLIPLWVGHCGETFVITFNKYCDIVPFTSTRKAFFWDHYRK
jgi:hypothetical protein